MLPPPPPPSLSFPLSIVLFVYFSAFFCAAHCDLDLTWDSAPYKCPLLLLSSSSFLSLSLSGSTTWYSHCCAKPSTVVKSKRWPPPSGVRRPDVWRPKRKVKDHASTEVSITVTVTLFRLTAWGSRRIPPNNSLTCHLRRSDLAIYASQTLPFTLVRPCHLRQSYLAIYASQTLPLTPARPCHLRQSDLATHANQTLPPTPARPCHLHQLDDFINNTSIILLWSSTNICGKLVIVLLDGGLRSVITTEQQLTLTISGITQVKQTSS